MKRLLPSIIVLSLLAAAPLTSVATTFFSDTFGSGSTLTNGSPAPPTTNSAAYTLSSSKSWSPAPSLIANDLKFGIASTTSGGIEVQAVFATNPIALVLVGDYIQMIVTFTNTAGLSTANCLLGFGLYDSGGVGPYLSGLNATALNSFFDKATGGVQNWKGYWGQHGYTGQNSRILNRSPQTTGTDNRNQNLTSTGSGTQSYGNPAAAIVGPQSTAPSGPLTVGATYTVLFKIQLIADTVLAITNTYYLGADTNGTQVCQFGGTSTNATGGTWVTGGFDALAIGWRAMAATTGGTVMDVSSIRVEGAVTVITTPPDILVQPVAVSAAAGSMCAYKVVASGYSMKYQWHRYGTNLVDGGTISGATTDTLIISSVSAADVASGVNGYSVTITGAGGYATNSVVVPLSLRTAANLVWSGAGRDWDLNLTANWLSGANPAVFNYGDHVTFNDTGNANLTVNLTNNFLSAGSVTVDSGYDYVFSGSGSIVGPGNLKYIGAGHLTINNANAYSGGTLISNTSAFLVLNNQSGLGTGPVTLAAPGTMQITAGASATTGLGDVVINDDFDFIFDANSAYAVVVQGNLAGASGKTLTITPNATVTNTARVRVYGTNTVCNADLNLANSYVVLASYQSSGGQTYDGVISGPGSFMQKGTFTYLNGPNTYSGGTVPAAGFIGLGRDSVGDPVTSGPIGTGPLLLTVDSTTTTVGSGGIFAFNGPRTIANPIQYPTGTNNLTLRIGGTNNLTLTGAFTLNGNDGMGSGTNRIIEVTNTGLTTISGVISGTGFGLTKMGTGVLALNNTETYTGTTVITNGTLLVNGQVGPGAVTVYTNGILGGNGTITGPVTVQAGGAIAPGASIGTLTINNNLSLAGNLNVEVNRSGFASDRISVSGTLANAGSGTVTVTNLGAALQTGDSFMLFSNNKPLSGGGAMTITGGGVIWTNKLAVDGTIAVVTPIATTPGPLSNSVSGGNLVLSWPLNYLTWTLQSNAVSVISSTNWFPVPGSQTNTQMVFPIIPTKTNVFYRLVR